MELVRDEQPPPAEAMAAAADDRTEQQEPSKVVCFGELLVDFVPTVGGLPVFDEPCFKAGAGGAPANVAVGICKLGIPAAFIGKVGDALRDEVFLSLIGFSKVLLATTDNNRYLKSLTVTSSPMPKSSTMVPSVSLQSLLGQPIWRLSR